MSEAETAVWVGPPPSPDPSVVSGDVSCHGALGTSLMSILEETLLTSRTSSSGGCELTNNDDESFLLDRDGIDRIMMTFRKSMANTQIARKNGEKAAPAALLRGQVNHYNRHKGKWRLALHAGEIRRRYQLDRHRRRKEKPSLWQVSDEMNPGHYLAPIRCKIEVLAYNDEE